MKLVHSNISEIAPSVKQPPVKRASLGMRSAYKAYQAACRMYENEIKEIQRVEPGWMPKFISNQ